MSFKIPFEILLITSSVGALQSAFFGFYLLSFKKGNKAANQLLAFLLLAFAVRMAKSVSYYFAEGHEIPKLLENIGYSAHIAITPLVWLYLNAYLKKDYRFHWLKHGIHLLPFVLIVLLSPFLTSAFWLRQGGYTCSLYLMGAYLPFCFYLVWQHVNNLLGPQRLWLFCLLIGVLLVWAAYVGNFLFGQVSYITAPVVFSIVMYFMSYLGLSRNNIFIQETKYKNSVFTGTEVEQFFNKLQELMLREKPYKDTQLTLPKLAKLSGASPNLLSQAINEKARQNFPDYINSYRVKEAQILLADSSYANQKIASIAFDAGFNTLSAFNLAFKKFTQSTPSEYRKKLFAD
jgi:AraC-like DNA-binding protein